MDRRSAAACVLAGALAAAGPALAEPSYPATLDAPTLAAWLSHETDVRPEQVVAVSPSAVSAIMSRARPSGRPALAMLRAEALTPEAASRTGLLAWEMRLEVDCKGDRIRAGATSGYAGRLPDGDGVAVAPADTDWRKPAAGTALEAAWRAVCDPRFKPPLAGAATRAAAAPPPSRPPAPAAPATAPATPPPAAPSVTTAALRGTLPVSADTSPFTAPLPQRRGPAAAQVVSSPSEADARRSLDQVRTRFGPRLAGLEMRVEPAQVRGRTVYRGLVAGFPGRDEAEAFCRTLKGKGQDCLVR
jgi:hypothetical protein